MDAQGEEQKSSAISRRTEKQNPQALPAVAHGMAREFGPRGIHVAHVIVDGVIDGDQVNRRFPQFKQQRGDDGMLDIDAIADVFWTLHTQHPSAWTLELDLRPYKEPF